MTYVCTKERTDEGILFICPSNSSQHANDRHRLKEIASGNINWQQPQKDQATAAENFKHREHHHILLSIISSSLLRNFCAVFIILVECDSHQGEKKRILLLADFL